MKLALLPLCLFAVLPIQAGYVYVGSVGTEPGVPITGQEDVVIYNLTGPTYGCSTQSGTPICTPVAFDNATLTINGTTPLNLGNILPGVMETYTLPGGTFSSGAITSLAFMASLSATTLQPDIGPPVSVNSAIQLVNIPVNGTLANLQATTTVAATPEPSFYAVLILVIVTLCIAHLWRERRGAVARNTSVSIGNRCLGSDK